MLASVPAATVLGVDGRAVTVEVHLTNGLPGFTMVGQPDTACREARDRVRAAIQSSGLAWPKTKITVNLAPSGVRKAGAGLDLAIAVGILVTSEVLEPEQLGERAFLGELGLDGSLRRVPGTLSMVDALREPEVVVPAAAHAEAALVDRIRVRSASSLAEVVHALQGSEPWPDPPDPPPLPAVPAAATDLADVKGQPLARWAVEVAAAGGHHLLLVGPPGSGKTMLAQRLAGVLPPLDRDLALQVTRIHSAAGLALPPAGLVDRAPLRAPHHGASPVALVGGGSAFLRPGEISLAHGGVLLLDEFGEFHPSVLESLRQPLEEGVVRVTRARGAAAFPARFQLVATMNPCPCGEGGAPGSCRCSDASRARYLRRLSGPLLDRFDLRVHVARPDVAELLDGPAGEPSAVVAERVARARQRAAARGVRTNAELAGRQLEQLAELSAPAARLLDTRLRRGGISPRGLHRLQRVARTIADLDGSEVVGEDHLYAALELRAGLPELEMAAS